MTLDNFQPYAFREVLENVHQPERLNREQVATFTGTHVTEQWCILRPRQAGAVLKQGAEDLRDYFSVSMGLEVPVVTDATPYRQSIQLIVDAQLPPRTFELRTQAGILIAGTDERAVAQGCYFFEDEMNLSGVPGLEPGTLRRTARFSPRIIHSGFGINMYPDPRLSAITHAGMDAIMVDLSEVMNKPDTCTAVNDVIRRAAIFGIDVYGLSFFKNERHPSDPDAQTYYTERLGRLFACCSGLKGIIFVGEACEFPSHDSRTTGRDWKSSLDDTKPSPGWFPCDDYPEFIALMRDVIREQKPDADVVFWTYNWGYLAADLRLKLIERLPTDITLMATFEMFESFEVAPGITEICTDYTLWSSGPGTYFATESAAAKRRGLRMYSMTNTGGNTWDIGTVPYLPAPYAWIDRFKAVTRAQDEWRLDGIMESWSYGFSPSIITELAKAAFFEPQPDLDDRLMRILVRDFGAAHAEAVLGALQQFSEGMRHCVPTNQDQYGPCRIGPAYPLFFERSEPLPIGPRSMRNPNQTCNPVYRYSPAQADKLRWETDQYTCMMELFKVGADTLACTAQKLKGLSRKRLDHLLGIARFIENTARTTVHVKRWHALKWRLGICIDTKPIWVGGRKGMPDARPLTEPERSPVEEHADILRELVDIAEAEINNAEATVKWVEANSRLGFTQELDYCTSPEQLRWKIAVTRRAVKEEILPLLLSPTP